MTKNTQITKMIKLARLILFITIMLPFVLKSQTFTPDMDKYPNDSLKGFNEQSIFANKFACQVTFPVSG